MSGSRLFWMAVQAIFVLLLTLPATLAPESPDKPKGVLIAFSVAIVIVGFMTSLVVYWKDAIIRRVKGIPSPPPAYVPSKLATVEGFRPVSTHALMSFVWGGVVTAAIILAISTAFPGADRRLFMLPALICGFAAAWLFRRRSARNSMNPAIPKKQDVDGSHGTV